MEGNDTAGLLFGTVRSEVRILSPRPVNLKLSNTLRLPTLAALIFARVQIVARKFDTQDFKQALGIRRKRKTAEIYTGGDPQSDERLSFHGW